VRNTDQLQDPGKGKIISRSICKKWNVEEWTGLIWLRIGTGGGLL
jgi:phenylpropionate dioxygenase-like ring-hydroxylating dioxygenase large terminal subunit